MIAIQNQIDAVQKIGEITIQLLDVEPVGASYYCPENDKGEPILEEDDQYLSTLLELKSVLEQVGDPEITDPRSDFKPIQDHFRRAIIVESEDDTGITIKFEVIYEASGRLYIGAKILVADYVYGIIDNFVYQDIEDEIGLNKVDVGRLVARAELMILMDNIESSADTLDYWILETSPWTNNEVTQSKWGDIRGVSRQAISERVTSAKEKLEELD